jgi:hypothetical protein
MKKLNNSEINVFSVKHSFLKFFLFTPFVLICLFLIFWFMPKIENENLSWAVLIGFILFISFFGSPNIWFYNSEEVGFASRNNRLVLWSHKDQLNFMDRVYAHDDIEEFLINDGFLKKKVSILFKDGSKEELSSYFLIFKYE